MQTLNLNHTKDTTSLDLKSVMYSDVQHTVSLNLTAYAKVPFLLEILKCCEQ